MCKGDNRLKPIYNNHQNHNQHLTAGRVICFLVYSTYTVYGMRSFTAYRWGEYVVRISGLLDYSSYRNVNPTRTFHCPCSVVADCWRKLIALCTLCTLVMDWTILVYIKLINLCKHWTKWAEKPQMMVLCKALVTFDLPRLREIAPKITLWGPKTNIFWRKLPQ